jgi:FAD/FMN-containing dehydrogenase/uncharacterized membrane protein YhaH (DUF805 family)
MASKETKLRDVLPVTYLLLTFRGRIDRQTYWIASLFMWSNFYIFYKTFNYLGGEVLTLPFIPLMLWGIAAVSAKRYHDRGKSGWHLLWLLLPVLGLLYVFFQLALRRGQKQSNRYGDVPGSDLDYYVNDQGQQIQHLKSEERIINDVTGLNPIIVATVRRPGSVAELVEILRTTTGPVSVGGGRFSMGGQTAYQQSLHIDMRQLNRVLAFSPGDRTITVEAGIRWCDIQEHIDANQLSVQIMQTYANFTVGGALSVNAHGRYMGLGPVILSVQQIRLILADGSDILCSREANKDLFFAAIGGYNAVGIIAEATLQLSENINVKRHAAKMLRKDYNTFFKYSVKDDKKVIFHNADIYPAHYQNVRAVSWQFTLDKPTVKSRLMPLRSGYPVHRYFVWAMTETPFGKWQREYIVDPLLYWFKAVHPKNYEAGYDVAELEPQSREKSTYVLLEYFVPVAAFDAFCVAMSEILKRHAVNMVNISVRYSVADNESYLAWAKGETFAFVMYYKQRVGDADKTSVAVWTRELIDAAIANGGAYYLPYQVHATREQFLQAYPRAGEFFALKKQFDPNYRFRNELWKHYYPSEGEPKDSTSVFTRVMSQTKYSDGIFLFFQNVFRLYPEARFHELVLSAEKSCSSDAEKYQFLLDKLGSIKPFMADIRFALPALFKQKREIARQTLQLLSGTDKIDGYLEIGTVGRYHARLRKALNITGPTFWMNDRPPGNSPPDILDREGFSKYATYIPLADYATPAQEVIAPASLDLITCYIGLHHIVPERLESFIAFIAASLRKGGKFILRDHEVRDSKMADFVSLVHTVFNAGTGESAQTEAREYRKFRPLAEWVEILARHGLRDAGQRLLQANDPTANTLMLFERQ